MLLRLHQLNHTLIIGSIPSGAIVSRETFFDYFYFGKLHAAPSFPYFRPEKTSGCSLSDSIIITSVKSLNLTGLHKRLDV